jgi:hypothetical protein
VLGEQFGEDDLLGEKLGADGKPGLLTLAAATQNARKKKEKDNAPFDAQGKEAQRTRSEREEEWHDREREKNLTQSSQRRSTRLTEESEK